MLVSLTQGPITFRGHSGDKLEMQVNCGPGKKFLRCPVTPTGNVIFSELVWPMLFIRQIVISVALVCFYRQ